MTSQVFDAQLLVPDNSTSHLKLVDLITAGHFTGSGLPDVAHRYLDAFCNQSYSNGRRRWAGIALAGMIHASTSVVQHLKKLSKGLSRLGAIILDPEESEERRIIAGLVVRQGLESGIDFADFWETDKVMHSAPNFPRDSSEQWMGQFQTYLDTLGNLALASLNNDPLILFPMSLSTNDGFQWTGKSAIAIIEKDLLTVVVSDSSLTKLQFLDIQVNHIKVTSLQQESPHESQKGRSGHKMHALVMTLEAQAFTYRLNSLNRTASELKVSFLSHEDADEFEIGLQDARKSLAGTVTATVKVAGSMASTSSVNDLRQSSEQRIDSTLLPSLPRQQEDAQTRPGATTDEPLSTKQSKEERGSTLHSVQDKGKGKLPRISTATKQKIIRTRQSPPVRTDIVPSNASLKAELSNCQSQDEDGKSARDEYSIKSREAAHSSVGPGRGRRLQSRRKANIEDDDFIPAASKARSKATKRKRGSSDVGEENRPNKKIQTKSSDVPKLITTDTAAMKSKAKAKAQKSVQTSPVRAREPMKQSTAQQNLQTRASSRPSLIGRLLKPKSPVKEAAPTFKKPNQPASTPRRPRAQPVRTTPRPQTPIESSRGTDNLPVCITSSTPRCQAVHDEDFGLHYTPADTEILSSNTKRVPDSPHAESTAISGHADCDDVHRDKWKGDMETARSDPFKQRRQGQRITSFTRKLTEESVTDDRLGSVHEELFSMPAEISNDDTEIDELSINFASQPLVKRRQNLPGYRTNHQTRAPTLSSPARTRELKVLSKMVNEPHQVATATSPKTTWSTRHEAAYKVHESQRHASSRSKHQARREPTPMETSKCTHIAKAVDALNFRVQTNDYVVSAPPEAVHDTLLDTSAQVEDQGDLHGDTTLIREEMDLPDQRGEKVSNLHFRSSPPIPDSSSVQGASDDSEAESDPSPPTSRADELEWEAALQPHQRMIHELLLRTSKRVMRHIVDSETAVTDITDVFADDGKRLVDLLLEQQSDECAEAFRDLAAKRLGLLKEMSDASKSLKAQRKQVKNIE